MGPGSTLPESGFFHVEDRGDRRQRLPGRLLLDGHAVAGLHLPTLKAPVATHTGWNLRKTGFAEGELCDNNGSMIPFAATKEDRLKTGDPRLSMAERYPNPGDRAAAIAKAAQQLVQDRLLLEEDAKLYAPNVN